MHTVKRLQPSSQVWLAPAPPTAPLLLQPSHAAPFCSTAPLKNEIAPWGALSPTLRTTVLEDQPLSLHTRWHMFC